MRKINERMSEWIIKLLHEIKMVKAPGVFWRQTIDIVCAV